jgi:uncharacterized repeat protein (TIGR01451 family)
MSTGGNFGRPLRRRNVLGATAIVAVVAVALLTLGSASGRQVAQHRAGDASAARSATSSTHVLSRAQGHASLVSRASGHAAQRSLSSPSSSFSLFPALGAATSAVSRSLAASITGCGDDGTIADASGFEDADGNLDIDNADCMDWNGFTPTWSGAPTTTAPPQTGTGSTDGFTFAGATDRFNSKIDNIYEGGVKQDTVCPGTVTGSANDKADLSAIYVSGERVGDQVYLFLAWERQLDNTVNSDVFVSFEFNQSKVACAAGSPFVERTAGDLLVEYNFQSGNSSIDVQEWDGTTWVPLATPPFEASVNAGTVTDTIRPDGPVDLTTFEFGEAGINLSELDLTGNGGKACETFGGVLGGSRTSKSGDQAQLKDFIGPAPLDISNCVQPTATTTLKNAADDSTIANDSSIADGSSVYDTTTLGNLVSGKTPTGKVQYTFFANGDCSGDGTSAGLKTLNADGSVPHSDTKGPLTPGDYSFNAQYLSGDDQNYSDSDVSDCEPFTVSKAQLTATTKVHDASHTDITGSSVALGSVVHDTAKLSGVVAGQTPAAITFAFYSQADCAGDAVAVANTGADQGDATADRSAASAALGAGDYSYKASVAGDANYLGDSSDCENFTVNKAQLTATTKVHDSSHADITGSSVALGSVVHDTAKLSGIVAGKTPAAITFAFYSQADCAGDAVAVANTGADEGDATADRSAASAALGAGDYSYKASVAGDANYLGDSSDCENFTVGKAQLTATTKVHDASHIDITNGSADLGSIVHDTAKLSGVVAGKTPAAITFAFYSQADCAGSPTAVANTGADEGDASADRSAASAALGAGDYSYKASVADNANYLGDSSDCENFSVGKAQLTATTKVHDASHIDITNGSVDLGSIVHDTAKLSGVVAGKTPAAITFAFYSQADCAGDAVAVANTGADEGDATADRSAASAALGAGSYSYKASVAGDANYLGDSSDCENFSVGKAQLTATTKVHDSNHNDITGTSVPVSSIVHDTAKLSGVVAGKTPAAITFAFYSQADCAGSPTAVANTGADEGDATADRSAASAALAAGSYSYKASVAGDANYLGDSSDCENFSVGKAQPKIVTTQDPASGSVGDTYKDTATLSDAVMLDGTGSITFTLYDATGCDGNVIDTETVNNISANGAYSTPTGVKLDTAGTYYWVASFGGDSNNLSADSGCDDEPVVVKPAAIHIVKTPDAAQVNAGDPIGFTLTVYNDGTGDAHGVTLSDTLPVKAGLSWSIASQGAGWNSTCAIAAGKLTCGPVTVPAGTTQAASTFTVHITSPTTGATGGDCPATGVVDNTGHVSTTNAGSDDSSASTCVQAVVDLSITKSGSPTVQELGQGNITWTMVVTNNGPSTATGVKISDPMPAGNTYVSSTTTQGTCTGGAILNCDIGTMAAGATVTITLVTTPSQAGTQTNTSVVSGDRPETTLTNNTATASVEVTAPFVLPCVKVSKITPKQLFVGRKTTLKIHLTQGGENKSGVRVRIKGKKFNVVTGRSNAKGMIKKVVKMKRSGVLTFTPLTTGPDTRCVGRIGVTGVFTPPVTG